MTISKDVLKRWVPFAILSTVFAGLAYGIAVHSFRQAANDPQVEIAENYADYLEAGTPVPDMSKAPKADLKKSLSTFVSFFDDKGALVGSTGVLNGTSPVPPAGVFDTARARGETRFTWQPEKGVRSAIVLRHYGGEKPGFILVGRSLKEVETRQSQALMYSAVGWVLALTLTLAAGIIL